MSFPASPILGTHLEHLGIWDTCPCSDNHGETAGMSSRTSKTEAHSPSQGSSSALRPVPLMPQHVTRAADRGLHVYGREIKWLFHQTLPSDLGSYCTLETINWITSTKPFGKPSCHFQKSRKMTFPPISGLNPPNSMWRVTNGSAAPASPKERHHTGPTATCLSGTRKCPPLLFTLSSQDHHLPRAGPASSRTSDSSPCSSAVPAQTAAQSPAQAAAVRWAH